MAILGTICYTHPPEVEVGMASAVMRQVQEFMQPEPETFFDKHFVKVAFVVSAIALLAITPLSFLLGTVAGYNLYVYTEPPLRPGDQIITIPNATFAIIGAMAAILSFTPAGAAGGLIFQAIPALGSIGIGSTAYRALKIV